MINSSIPPHPFIKLKHEKDDEFKWNDQPDCILEV